MGYLGVVTLRRGAAVQRNVKVRFRLANSRRNGRGLNDPSSIQLLAFWTGDTNCRQAACGHAEIETIIRSSFDELRANLVRITEATCRLEPHFMKEPWRFAKA